MIELLRSRRSVRHYQERKIEPEKAALLEEALLRSPTSMRKDHPEFIFVDDCVLLEKLAEVKPHGSAFLRDAALAVVVCGDEDRSDVWVEDCSIASILLQLTAHSLGIGSCWVQIPRRQHADGETSESHVQQLLDIPRNMRVVSIVALGYPERKGEPIPEAQLQRKRIHRNRFN